MKNKIQNLLIALGLLSILNLQPSTAFAQGTTAFSYQGKLNDGTNLAHGNYDLTFALYATISGGSAVAGPLTNSATIVTNGLFSVTMDFGSSVFNGSLLWLEIGVRTNGSATAFTTLSPRQQLLPVPYALYAMTPTGPAGPTGPQGPQGPQGPAGPAGAGLPSGGIIMWSGTLANIPSGWVLCDGSNGSPDLRNRFIVGAGNQYSVGAVGGSTTHNHGGSTGSSGQTYMYQAVGGFAAPANHVHSITADSNLPPYYALCFIVKQ